MGHDKPKIRGGGQVNIVGASIVGVVTALDMAREVQNYRDRERSKALAPFTTSNPEQFGGEPPKATDGSTLDIARRLRWRRELKGGKKKKRK